MSYINRNVDAFTHPLVHSKLNSACFVSLNLNDLLFFSTRSFCLASCLASMLHPLALNVERVVNMKTVTNQLNSLRYLSITIIISAWEIACQVENQFFGKLPSRLVAGMIPGEISEKEVVDNMVLLTFAAQDTTSFAIATTFKMLSQHPNCCSLLLQGIIFNLLPFKVFILRIYRLVSELLRFSC